MIEGIYQIGNTLGNDLILGDEAKVEKNKTYKICIINFDTNNQKVKLSLDKEYSKGDEEKYRFISLRLSGRQNQFFITFKDLKRLIIETDKKTGNKKIYASWISLKDELNFDNSLLSIVKNVYEIFYKDNEFDFGKFEEGTINDLSSLKKYIKKELGQNEEVIFYTISVNNELICEKKEYVRLLTEKIVDSKKKKGRINCSICGNECDEYFDDFARMPLKFFINDKVGFSQKLSNNWDGNFILCKNCYINLLNGQKFVMQKSYFKLNKMNYIIIPEFPEKIDVDSQKFKEWFEDIKNYYNPFKFFDDDFIRERLKEYQEYGIVQYFWLTYLFFEQNNQQFKIYSVIKDIPKSRIEEIRNKFVDYSNIIFNNFPSLNQLKLKSLADIYWIIPLRFSSKDNKILELPKILGIFSNILEDRFLNRKFLIKEFWVGIKAKYFNNLSYHNVRKSDTPDFELTNYILRTHHLLMFLNILKGGNDMNKNTLEIPDSFKIYLDELKFNAKQQSLFLLGTLIADIASKQIKYGNKPILNKINFQGMGIDRIMILFNEIYEKLQQEKLLNKEREKTYSISHRIFDKEKNNWNLKPHENVYYILSGYSHKTFLSINEAKNKLDNKAQENKLKEV